MKSGSKVFRNFLLILTQNFSGLPFLVKLLPGILCDSVSIPGFGRRKTWALVGHLLMAISLYILHAKFDDWVEAKNILGICLAKILLYCGAAIQGHY